MKKTGTIILYFLIGIVAFCQNFSLDGIYPFQEDSLLSMMTIQDGKVILKYENPPINNLDQEISYKIEKEYGLSFIVLSENMPKEVANWKDYEDKRIGRLLPPYNIRLKSQLLTYLQRQALPSIPEKALKG